MYRSDSPVQVHKVKFGGSNQFGIAAKRLIRRNEYIFECHGMTPAGVPGPNVARFSIIWKGKGRKQTQVVLAGPARLLNHHCKPNTVVRQISYIHIYLSLNKYVAGSRLRKQLCVLHSGY